MNALVLPAHGNAPYLLGVRLLRNVADEILLPDFYGDIQRRILREEFPADADRIFLSGELGSLLQPLLLDQALTPDIAAFSRSVRENVDAISTALAALCRNGLSATSLNNQTKRFSRFDLALNTGLPIHAPVRPVFYAFVGKMSAIYELSPHQSADILALAETWKQIEASFERMFIPRLNSLSYLDYDHSGITFTPPFARPYPPDETNLPQGSALVIASGTGLDVEKLLQLASSHPTHYVTLNDSPSQVPFARVPSTVWGNGSLSAVLARSGFGSIWQAMVNQKPIGVIRPRPQDDPEVFHNAQVVEWSGIGRILDDDAAPLFESMPRYASAIQGQLNIEMEQFDTIDGIAYTSADLRRRMNEYVSKLSL